MNTYTAEFKAAIVQKWFSGKYESFAHFARSHNLPDSTVSKWMPRPVSSSRSQGSSTWLGKATILYEWRNLAEHDRGPWLRQTGHTENELEKWENEVGMKQHQEMIATQKELRQIENRNIQLEKELDIKNQALADVTARWMMLKKKQILFGEAEED